MQDIVHAIRKVLGAASYVVILLTLAVAIFWLFLAIPANYIPGNDLAFQMSILTRFDLFLLVTLSILTALAIVMNVYILRRKSTLKDGVSFVAQGSIGGFSGIVASVFGTATCGACVAAIFGFLGVGGVFFLFDYRTQITVGAIGLLLISLYFTSRKVLGNCEICTVQGRNHDHK